MREKEPIYCGICGSGILETENPSGPKEGTEKIAQSNQAWDMEGSDDIKREAQKAWALKIGFCDDCMKKYDPDKRGGLDKILSQISLTKVAKIPEQ